MLRRWMQRNSFPKAMQCYRQVFLPKARWMRATLPLGTPADIHWLRAQPRRQRGNAFCTPAAKYGSRAWCLSRCMEHSRVATWRRAS